MQTTEKYQNHPQSPARRVKESVKLKMKIWESVSSPPPEVGENILKFSLLFLIEPKL